jgi:hypothetical protein
MKVETLLTDLDGIMRLNEENWGFGEMRQLSDVYELWVRTYGCPWRLLTGHWDW